MALEKEPHPEHGAERHVEGRTLVLQRYFEKGRGAGGTIDRLRFKWHILGVISERKAEVKQTKSAYLVVYDYGMGGVWAFIRARSQDEIKACYPELRIVESRPAWMTDEDHARIAANRTFDIDDAPSGWLLAMIQKSSSRGTNPNELEPRS